MFEEFSKRLHTGCGPVAYGSSEVELAVQQGCVSHLLTTVDTHKSAGGLVSRVKAQGGSVLHYTLQNDNTDFIASLGGRVAILRFELATTNDSDYESSPEDDHLPTSTPKQITAEQPRLSLDEILAAHHATTTAAHLSQLTEEALEEFAALEAIYPCGQSPNQEVQFARADGTCFLLVQVADRALCLKACVPAAYPNNEAIQLYIETSYGIPDVERIIAELRMMCSEGGVWEGEPVLFNIALHLQEAVAGQYH